jgi:hypothetical protein
MTYLIAKKDVPLLIVPIKITDRFEKQEIL